MPADPSATLLNALWQSVEPLVPWAIAAACLLALLRMPLLGRGPGWQRRDPWRTFKYGPRRHVLVAADHRCEAPLALMWGRCRRAAEQIDHIYPWSKGGATITSNGQALCAFHNRNKGSRTPPWWYVLGLERRRRNYYPGAYSLRVSASMSAEERAQRSP